MNIKTSRLIGLFFLFTILVSTTSTPVFAAAPKNNCFKILWFTICIPIPPKPTPPNIFPFPTKKPTPSPTIKPTSTPTPTITPSPTATPTPTPDTLTFVDDFLSSVIDNNKWNITNNGGSVGIESGNLVLGNSGTASPYPFVDTKPNPFPTNGSNYQVEIDFRFDGSIIIQEGMTIAASVIEQPSDTSWDSSPYINNTNFWMRVNGGKFQMGFANTGNEVFYAPYDNNQHRLVFKRLDNVSTIYFDEQLVTTSSLNFSLPTNIWAGMANSVGFGSRQYPRLLLDSVTVRPL